MGRLPDRRRLPVAENPASAKPFPRVTSGKRVHQERLASFGEDGIRVRYLVIGVFMLAASSFGYSQGPSTEVAVKEGRLPMAEDGFSFTNIHGNPIDVS